MSSTGDRKMVLSFLHFMVESLGANVNKWPRREQIWLNCCHRASETSVPAPVLIRCLRYELIVLTITPINQHWQWHQPVVDLLMAGRSAVVYPSPQVFYLMQLMEVNHHTLVSVEDHLAKCFQRHHPNVRVQVEGEMRKYGIFVPQQAGGGRSGVNGTLVQEITREYFMRRQKLTFVEFLTLKNVNIPSKLVELCQDCRQEKFYSMAALLQVNATIKTLPVPVVIPVTDLKGMAFASEVIQVYLRATRNRLDEKPVIAVDVKGSQEEIYWIQLAIEDAVIVVDTTVLDVNVVFDFLQPLLMTDDIVKLFHNIYKCASSLYNVYNISVQKVLDTQLAAECLELPMQLPLYSMLEAFEMGCLPKIYGPDKLNNSIDFKARPMPQHIHNLAAIEVMLLLKSLNNVIDHLDSNIEDVLQASKERVNNAIAHHGKRLVWFDPWEKNRLISVELLVTFYPEERGKLEHQTIQIEANIEKILEKVPDRFAVFMPDDSDNVIEIVLDKGRIPYVKVGSQLKYLCTEEDPLYVTSDEIKDMVEKIGESKFGNDNRAGIDGELHRISAMRNKNEVIYGLTLRVGRSIEGICYILKDILECKQTSILLLGRPGSGKTTMIRDITRYLADSHDTVCIIDTSNEIGGDGDIPHDCIGGARRMMVPTLNDQSRVMIECIQNHTPDVMIIDEIGRAKEVQASRTTRQRGVRLIASAHGNFKTLLRNKDLNGLLGGTEVVTVSDKLAANGSKLRTQRAGEPTFDVIVELNSEDKNAINVILSTEAAVDDVLRKNSYRMQRRIRDPVSGCMQVFFCIE